MLLRSLIALLAAALPVAHAADAIGALATRDWAGQNATLQDLGVVEAEHMVLNFWATWCPPCRDELPWLLELHEAGAIRLLAVNVGDREVDVARFLRETGIGHLPVRFVGAGALGRLALPGLPTSYLLHPDRDPIVHYGPLTPEALRAAFPEAPWPDP